MALISQREYARRRGISDTAVRKRTVKHGGPIPTYGRAQQIDPDEADRLWRATMRPNGAASSRFQGPPEPDEPPGGAAAFLGTVHALTQARTATMLVEAQLRRLRLEERRGQLLDRQTTLAKFFTVLRSVRDGWLAWTARTGPELAADLPCPQCNQPMDPTRLMIALEPYVRRQLDELAAARLELAGGGRRPGP